MTRHVENIALAVIAGALLWLATHWQRVPSAPVAPHPAPVPEPLPPPSPEPVKPARKPRLPWREAAEGEQLIGAQPNAPDGTEPEVDYPDAEWMKNIGSKLNGAGMCVFTSFEHSARWAGVEEFRGFRDWCAARYPGGGYPEKLHKLIVAYCAAKSIPREVFDPERDVVQIEAPPDKAVALIEAALRQNVLPCVTLYYSPNRYRGRIYHMINLAHLDATRGAELDNNYRPLEWSARAETIRRMTLNGRIWAVCILRPGPPPLPRNH